MELLQCKAGVAESALGAAVGLGRCFVGFAVLGIPKDFKVRRQWSATKAHIDLLLCVWPALDGALQGQLQSL